MGLRVQDAQVGESADIARILREDFVKATLRRIAIARAALTTLMNDPQSPA